MEQERRENIDDTRESKNRGTLKSLARFMKGITFYDLWKRGDEFDIRYTSLYREVKAKRIKLGLVLLSICICAYELINISEKYFSRPASAEYKANIPEQVELPVVLFTFDQKGILAPDENSTSPYPALDIQNPSEWWFYGGSSDMSNTTFLPGSTADARNMILMNRKLALFVDLQEKLMRRQLLTNQELSNASAAFWEWFLKHSIIMRCENHSGKTCSEFELFSGLYLFAKQSMTIMGEDADQPGYAVFRSSVGDFKLVAHYSAPFFKTTKLHPDLAIAFYPKREDVSVISLFTNSPFVSFETPYISSGDIPRMVVTLVSRRLFANASFLWNLPGDSFPFEGPSCERSLLFQGRVMHKLPWMNCVDDATYSELKEVVSKFVETHVLQGNLCRLPWIPRSMLSADVASSNNKVQIHDCTSRNKTTYLASLKELHQQILLQANRRSPACSRQPCSILNYRLLRITDTCEMWRDQTLDTERFVVALMPVEEVIQAIPTYNLIDALDDIGGILGLFFGTSLLSLYESFEMKLFPTKAQDYELVRRKKDARTPISLFDKCVLNVRLSCGGCTFGTFLNRSWGLWFAINACVCIWQIEVFSEDYESPTPKILYKEATNLAMRDDKRLGITIMPGPVSATPGGFLEDQPPYPLTLSTSTIVSCATGTHPWQDCSPRRPLPGFVKGSILKSSIDPDEAQMYATSDVLEVWEPLSLPERAIGGGSQKRSGYDSSRAQISVSGLLYTHPAASPATNSPFAKLGKNRDLVSMMLALRIPPESSSANKNRQPTNVSLQADEDNHCDITTSDEDEPWNSSVGQAKRLSTYKRRMFGDGRMISHIVSIWAMDNGRPRLFQPTVHTAAMREKLITVDVRLTVRKRLPRNEEQRICETRVGYSWTQCCLESYLQGYIRQWYRSVMSLTEIHRYNEPWSTLGNNNRTTAVPPCYFDWLVGLSNVTNQLMPCSDFKNNNIHTDLVGLVLQLQTQNDGVMSDLGAGTCNCLPPCESVEFLSMEQYGLLTIRKGSPKWHDSALVSLQVSRTVDDFTDVDTLTLQKLVGAAGGAVGLYLGFSALSLHTFVETLLMKIKAKEFGQRLHSGDGDSDSSSDDD